jgi:hypothetical protein
VRAYNAAGNSAYSNTASAKPSLPHHKTAAECFEHSAAVSFLVSLVKYLLYSPASR